MIAHVRRLSKQTLIFGLGEAVAKFAALVLLPLYTHLLTPGDYGELAIVTLVTSAVTVILNSGQGSAFFRFYFEFADDSTRQKLVGTELIYLLSVSVLGVFILEIILWSSMGRALFSDATILPLLQVAVIGVFFDIGSLVPFAMFRAQQRAYAYAMLSIGRFVISIALNILVVALLRWGSMGVVIANLISSIIFFLACLIFMVRHIQWTINPNLLSSLLRFGFPLVPANLAGWALTLVDRLFLERYTGLRDVGIYSLGYSIAGIVSMISGWFNTAYAPYVFSISKQPDAKLIYARLMTYAITGFTALGLVIALFSRLIISIVSTPDYASAVWIVPIIILSYLFFEVNYILSFGFDLSGKTLYYPIVVGTSAIINLVLNFYLIPTYGMMGAAWATVLSFLVLPILNYLLVRRLYPISYEWGRLFKLTVNTVGIYFVSIFIPTSPVWIEVFVKLGLLAIWLLGLYVFKFFQTEELNMFRVSFTRGSTFLSFWFRSRNN